MCVGGFRACVVRRLTRAVLVQGRLVVLSNRGLDTMMSLLLMARPTVRWMVTPAIAAMTSGSEAPGMLKILRDKHVLPVLVSILSSPTAPGDAVLAATEVMCRCAALQEFRAYLATLDVTERLVLLLRARRGKVWHSVTRWSLRTLSLLASDRTLPELRATVTDQLFNVPVGSWLTTDEFGLDRLLPGERPATQRTVRDTRRGFRSVFAFVGRKERRRQALKEAEARAAEAAKAREEALLHPLARLLDPTRQNQETLADVARFMAQLTAQWPVLTAGAGASSGPAVSDAPGPTSPVSSPAVTTRQQDVNVPRALLSNLVAVLQAGGGAAREAVLVTLDNLTDPAHPGHRLHRAHLAANASTLHVLLQVAKAGSRDDARRTTRVVMHLTDNPEHRAPLFASHPRVCHELLTLAQRKRAQVLPTQALAGLLNLMEGEHAVQREVMGLRGYVPLMKLAAQPATRAQEFAMRCLACLSGFPALQRTLKEEPAFSWLLTATSSLSPLGRESAMMCLYHLCQATESDAALTSEELQRAKHVVRGPLPGATQVCRRLAQRVLRVPKRIHRAGCLHPAAKVRFAGTTTWQDASTAVAPAKPVRQLRQGKHDEDDDDRDGLERVAPPVSGPRSPTRKPMRARVRVGGEPTAGAGASMATSPKAASKAPPMLPSATSKVKKVQSVSLSPKGSDFPMTGSLRLSPLVRPNSGPRSLWATSPTHSGSEARR